MSNAIPVWVFAILLVLVGLGYLQAQTRVVAPRRVILVAAGMFAFSLYGVCASFGLNALPLLAWAAGLGIAVALGRRIFGPHGLTRSGEAVRIPGSWLPMGLMLGIFAAKFALGFANGVGSAMVHELWFVAATSAVLGLLSGGFTARAVVVHRFVGAVARG